MRGLHWVWAGTVPLTEEERAAERERRQERRAAVDGHDILQGSDDEGGWRSLLFYQAMSASGTRLMCTL